MTLRPVSVTTFLLVFVFTISRAAAQPASRPAETDRPFLKAAVQAAAWIRAQAVETKDGLAWPADPDGKKEIATNLYAGTPGVILFFLELHRATGDAVYLNDAKRGADYLLATLPEKEKFGPEEAGLYTGMAGVGFTLDQVFRATKAEKYRQGALRCVELLHKNAQPVGDGVEWSNSTDIISGSAGIGLFLLYAAREMDHKPSLELAKKAGRRLLALGQPAPGGRRWRMDPTFERIMPNFSHGTAGVAYFLAALSQATGEKEFLDAALEGARHLRTLAKTENETCLIYHHDGDGEGLFYLSWCHGPAGTARLFYRLWQATGDEEWLKWVRRSAAGVMQSGIPEKRTPGFWNNVGQCCGSAGVAEFMLHLHAVTKDRAYLDFAEKMLRDALQRGTPDTANPREPGLKWIQAEHRVKPDFLVAQTGYAQGAAGIGLALLHWDAVQQDKKRAFTLPDSPF